MPNRKPAAALAALLAALVLAACQPKAEELTCEGGVSDISRMGELAPPPC